MANHRVSNIADILDFLDEVVRADAAPAGFLGTVCFGLKGTTSVRWWSADFGKTVRTSFSSEKPSKYDVAVGLDETGALRMMGAPTDGDGLQMVAGNKQLLRRFSRRYFGSKKALHWRLAGARTS